MTGFFKAVKAFLLKGGATPGGKAVEHAVVAGVSVAASMIVADLVKGNLNLTSLSAAAIAGGTIVLAGIRAYWKRVSEAPA